MRLAGLTAEVRRRAQWCLAYAAKYGVRVTLTSTRRSEREQAALYKAYLEGRSKYPALPPGQSKHQRGLAWDSWVEPAFREWWIAVRRYAGFRVPDSDWIHAEL